MADILNQDEIDRLLNATGFDAPPEFAEMSPHEVETAEKVLRVFFAAANSALGTLLARPVSVTDDLGQVVDIAALDTGSSILLEFPFRSGFAGNLCFLLPTQDAAVLADLILGGDGAAKETLDEGDLDALQEALTQVAGSGAPTLSTMFGTEVGFGPPQAKAVERRTLADDLGLSQAFLCTGKLKVEELLESPLRILLSVGLAQEMAGRAGSGMAAEAPRAPRAPAAAHAAPTTAPSAARSAGPAAPPPDIRNIDLILDIEVEVMVRLGEAQMTLREIQQLRPGSIINLDKDTDARVELVVNDKVIAKGELVVVGSDHFALRITEIETPIERIRTLGS
ncbi:MAG TPA: FliM/FliN family flagellar motor switch protein [Deferrisomatales bacterium]|nr:FliM/FliN family flagellar motor switch protein [Deferrisomatales bacterium]